MHPGYNKRDESFLFLMSRVSVWVASASAANQSSPLNDLHALAPRGAVLSWTKRTRGASLHLLLLASRLRLPASPS